MKISRTISFQIEGATFTFEKPKANDVWPEDRGKYNDFIFARLKKVEGLEEEDGSPIELQAFRELSLPQDVVNQIVLEYGKALRKLHGVAEETEEKKIHSERLLKLAEWRLVIDPGLNCSNCNDIKKKHGKKRKCDLPGGCEIEDVATDIELNSEFALFMQCKALSASTGDPEIQRIAADRLDLRNDIQTYIRLESLYADAVRIQREKHGRRNSNKNNPRR